jgi:hypothetical protein
LPSCKAGCPITEFPHISRFNYLGSDGRPSAGKRSGMASIPSRIALDIGCASTQPERKCIVMELKAKWDALETPMKAVVGVVAAIVSLVVVFKILPSLIEAMSMGALIALLILPYWIPTIIAFVRHHPSKGGILAMNLFLGWTFIGWVLAFVWALSDNSGRAVHQTVVVNTSVAAMVPPAQPTYQIGDVVNGHRFNGHAWLPAVDPQAPLSVETPATPAIDAPSATAPEEAVFPPSGETVR